jgi:hypothetical protein
MVGFRDNISMRQLQFFTTAELGRMRDRTAARNHSPERDEFRRLHAHRRAWGLAQRHGRRLRQLRTSSCAPRPAHPPENARQDGAPTRPRPRLRLRLRPWPRPWRLRLRLRARLWLQLRPWFRLRLRSGRLQLRPWSRPRVRCRLSGGNAQHRQRSSSDDPRHGTSPRATSTSQPVQSRCPRHHTPAPRCHLPGPVARRQPAPGTAQSAALARIRTRSHRIRADPRRDRRRSASSRPRRIPRPITAVAVLAYFCVRAFAPLMPRAHSWSRCRYDVRRSDRSVRRGCAGVPGRDAGTQRRPRS